ncbi:MAG: hypothetical protein VKL39_03720 [Leptolyngbyaceae bacterium]|nr:hypothetical protein [Leptolyngbyaceae bacterium]
MEIALILAALIVSFLVFTWLIRVVKATITTALTIALVVLVVQLVFGIGPQDLWQTLSGFWRQLWGAIAG